MIAFAVFICPHCGRLHILIKVYDFGEPPRPRRQDRREEEEREPEHAH